MTPTFWNNCSAIAGKSVAYVGLGLVARAILARLCMSAMAARRSIDRVRVSST